MTGSFKELAARLGSPVEVLAVAEPVRVFSEVSLASSSANGLFLASEPSGLDSVAVSLVVALFNSSRALTLGNLKSLENRRRFCVFWSSVVAERFRDSLASGGEELGGYAMGEDI